MEIRTDIDLDIIRIQIDTVHDALSLVTEQLWQEAYQPAGKFEAWKAQCFINRLEMFNSTFTVIMDSLSNISKELESAERIQ